jgi:hypothetical protein
MWWTARNAVCLIVMIFAEMARQASRARVQTKSKLVPPSEKPVVKGPRRRRAALPCLGRLILTAHPFHFCRLAQRFRLDLQHYSPERYLYFAEREEDACSRTSQGRDGRSHETARLSGWRWRDVIRKHKSLPQTERFSDQCLLSRVQFRCYWWTRCERSTFCALAAKRFRPVRLSTAAHFLHFAHTSLLPLLYNTQPPKFAAIDPTRPLFVSILCDKLKSTQRQPTQHTRAPAHNDSSEPSRSPT